MLFSSLLSRPYLTMHNAAFTLINSKTFGQSQEEITKIDKSMAVRVQAPWFVLRNGLGYSRLWLLTPIMTFNWAIDLYWIKIAQKNWTLRSNKCNIFVPRPHSVRKGNYWIRHRLSVRPSVHPVSPNVAHFEKNTIILSRRGTLELRVHWFFF